MTVNKLSNITLYGLESATFLYKCPFCIKTNQYLYLQKTLISCKQYDVFIYTIHSE